MPRDRTVDERVGDWKRAYDSIRPEITPDPLRHLITQMTTAAVPPEGSGPDVVATYASLVQSSMSLARLVAENDRVAATVAEALTHYGLQRPRED